MMATKFIQPPIRVHHVLPPKSNTIRFIKLHRAPPLTRFWTRPCVKAAAAEEQISGLPAQYTEDCKQGLFAALKGIDNRGIFGVPSPKKFEIEKFVELLESQNPNPQPTLCLEKLGGTWKLIYSTITVLGSKRTKLGLRDFITLGDFLQSIDVAERVDITYEKSAITPDQLMSVFRKNYDLLLSIFNPQGWLEITYVDNILRIGRDDKGNIFILERVEDYKP
ncbi:hypothetical protein RD792_010453 [Penstemon davidsonii]|uniref:Plastid lipid-associated protein/fibrillin conserved domain-containing protein n=1 Tax=Penstemon davidsonii TaxID=160366 RepID=A0ABR0D3D8_9LAMI|nr:hypothetical protein RD792_010453 [Penstemon davidsonii]